MKNEIQGVVIDVKERGRGSRLMNLVSPLGMSTVFISGSHFRGASRHRWSDLIQPLQQVELLVEKKSFGWNVLEGAVLERYEGIRQDWEAMQAAQSFRLAIKKLVKSDLPCLELYLTLLAHLQILHSHLPAPKVLASFLVKALWLEGYLDAESLPACLHCQASHQPLWNGSDGWACREHKLEGQPWSLNQQQLMLHLANNRSLASLKEPQELEIVPLLKLWFKGL